MVKERRIQSCVSLVREERGEIGIILASEVTDIAMFSHRYGALEIQDYDPFATGTTWGKNLTFGLFFCREKEIPVVQCALDHRR